MKNDRGKEFIIPFLKNFLKISKIFHYSRFTDKFPSFAERVKRKRKSLGKPDFRAGTLQG